MKAVGALATVLGMLLVSAAAAGPVETQVASCERGPIAGGSGPPDWRSKSVSAGPLGVFRHPLSQMSETNSGQLIAKMPVITEGHKPLTLSVPPRQRHRVFIYYGRLRDRNGNPTTQLGKAPGFSEVEFEPCTDRPRTAWPGGIRVKGRKPVRLTVRTEDDPEPIPLPLGRPKVHD
jgi:hypothetical protein